MTRMKKMAVMVVLYCHCAACSLYAFNCLFGDCSTVFHDSWEEGPSESLLDRYLTVLQWVVQTMLNAGQYGIEPYTYPMLVFSFCVMLSGVFVMGTVLSGLARYHRYSYESRVLYLETVEMVTKFFQLLGLTNQQVSPVFRYCLSVWYQTRGLSLYSIMKTVNRCLRTDICSELYSDHLQGTSILCDLEPAFIRQLCMLVKEDTFVAGNYVALQGCMDQTLYVVQEGNVDVLLEGTVYQEDHVATLGPKSFFGQVQVLHPNSPHPYSYRARTDTVMYSLKAEDMQYALKYFPEARQQLQIHLSSLLNEYGADATWSMDPKLHPRVDQETIDIIVNEANKVKRSMATVLGYNFLHKEAKVPPDTIAEASRDIHLDEESCMLIDDVGTATSSTPFI